MWSSICKPSKKVKALKIPQKNLTLINNIKTGKFQNKSFPIISEIEKVCFTFNFSVRVVEIKIIKAGTLAYCNSTGEINV